MTLGSGALAPFPFVGLGLVVLLEFFDEQVGDATLLGEVEEGASSVRVETGSEFDLLASASDVVRGVFRDSVPEVVDAPLAVFLIGRLFPDFTNLVSDSVSEDTTLHQPVEDLMPFGLIQFRAGEDVENLALAIEDSESVVHSTRGEFDIKRSGMFTHQVDARLHHHRSVGADHTEQANDQRDFHRAVEGIAEGQLEFEVVLLHLEAVVIEGVVSEHPRSVLRDIDLASEPHSLGREDGFGSLDEFSVLNQRVAFRDRLEAHARVLADIAVERGGGAIGQVEAFLRDEVERVVRHLGFGFGGIRDLVFHSVGFFWIRHPWGRRA